MLTLRVRMPIVADLCYPRNFITKIIKWAGGWGWGGLPGASSRLSSRLQCPLTAAAATTCALSLPARCRCAQPLTLSPTPTPCRYDKVINIPNSMTVLPELLPLSIEMARRKLTGIMNFTNPGAVSHNEILEVGRACVREWQLATRGGA